MLLFQKYVVISFISPEGKLTAISGLQTETGMAPLCKQNLHRLLEAQESVTRGGPAAASVAVRVHTR